MREYILFAKVAGEWIAVAQFKAIDHRSAMGAAAMMLPPEHYDKQIKLEEITEPAMIPKPN